VFKVVVLYGEAPDAQQYEEHAELCRAVPGATFRHGRVLGAPMGEAAHAYYAEWEFPDQASFDAGVKSDEFMATGKDAYRRGWTMPTVEFVAL
jgi:hypothetical protein